MNNLKPIDQLGIKALIKKRLENPQKYVDIPLIIWRADIRDEQQEDILREVFDSINEGKTRRERLWYKIASVRQLPYTKSDILYSMLHNPYVDKNDNEPYLGPVTVYMGDNVKRDMHEVALMVIDPIFAPLDYSRNPEVLTKYHSVINDRKWGNIGILSGVPVVAYMSVNHDWFETPEVYPKAEQYIYVAN